MVACATPLPAAAGCMKNIYELFGSRIGRWRLRPVFCREMKMVIGFTPCCRRNDWLMARRTVEAARQPAGLPRSRRTICNSIPGVDTATNARERSALSMTTNPPYRCPPILSANVARFLCPSVVISRHYWHHCIAAANFVLVFDHFKCI